VTSIHHHHPQGRKEGIMSEQSRETAQTEEPEVEGHKMTGPEDPSVHGRFGRSGEVGEDEGPEVEGHLFKGSPEDPSVKG
jgi:hypothetical protein